MLWRGAGASAPTGATRPVGGVCRRPRRRCRSWPTGWDWPGRQGGRPRIREQGRPSRRTRSRIRRSRVTWPNWGRDEGIGGSKATRDASIQQVLCPHRLGMLPRVRVPGGASAGWRQAVSRGIDDGTARSPIRPVRRDDQVAADPSGYRDHGADWTRLGLTSGRRGAVGPGWAIAGADDGRETRCRVPPVRSAPWLEGMTGPPSWTGQGAKPGARTRPTGGYGLGGSRGAGWGPGLWGLIGR